MFDRDCSFSKTKQDQDHTKITNIQSTQCNSTTLPPSFNLHTFQKSTPIAPKPAPRMFAPTPNRQTRTSETTEIEIDVHQSDENSTAYVTARDF
jgi:hypothetical protein